MSYTTDNLAAAVTRILQEFASGHKAITITSQNNIKTIKVVNT